MRRLGLLIAFALASVSAHAQTTTAIIVQVQGTGVVRVHITGGGATLFNDHMQAGQTITLASPTPCVVVEHTYGSFREVQWSPTRVFCPRYWRGGPHENFTRVDVSTDSPY
jgi:hypothetical protein